MRKTTTKSLNSLECLVSFNKTGQTAMTQGAISEQELIDNLASKAVKEIALVQGDDNKFRIFATLTWKEGRQVLETQRKKPRVWASLDRLVRRINSSYQSVPVIQLELRSKNGSVDFERANRNSESET